jgi:hypothetical protein
MSKPRRILPSVVDEEALHAAQSGYPLLSPVPGDDDLWDGVEKPFTSFGQFGVDQMDLRVFDQDTWWVDRLGQPHRLTQMSVEYRRNVLRFLLDTAEQRWLDTVMFEAITAMTDALRGKAAYGAIANAAGAPFVRDLAPETWLEGTPLMRRLRALTPGGPADVLPEHADGARAPVAEVGSAGIATDETEPSEEASSTDSRKG